MIMTFIRLQKKWIVTGRLFSEKLKNINCDFRLDNNNNEF